MIRTFSSLFFIFVIALTLSACGFHLRGEWHFEPRLQKIYLDTANPYGRFARELKQQLKASNASMTETKVAANIVLRIEQDSTEQVLLGINATQQTRQYKLITTIAFSLQDPDGTTILPTQIVQDNRVITIQSSQILGSSNEINLFTQQMQIGLAYAILNRLESQEIAYLINNHFTHKKITRS